MKEIHKKVLYMLKDLTNTDHDSSITAKPLASQIFSNIARSNYDLTDKNIEETKKLLSDTSSMYLRLMIDLNNWITAILSDK